MKEAIFYIGLPGSGKSTHIKDQNYGYPVISADNLKENHPDYDPNNTYVIHEWSVKEAEKMVYDAINVGNNFVFDSGGVNNSYSKRIMTKVKDYGYIITLVFVDTPLYECLKRIVKRERKVPVDDIFNKFLKLKSSLEIQKSLSDNFIHVKYYTDENLIFDMDGTIVEYKINILRNEYIPSEIKIDYINNNVFEYTEPVIPVIEKIKQYYANKNIYILSVSQHSETNKQKTNWLKKHLPFIKTENIYFVGDSEKKITVLTQIMKKHKLNKQNTTYIDDLHSMLWEAANQGINAIHISTFLTNKY
jgi:predicted kinase